MLNIVLQRDVKIFEDKHKLKSDLINNLMENGLRQASGPIHASHPTVTYIVYLNVEQLDPHCNIYFFV